MESEADGEEMDVDDEDNGNEPVRLLSSTVVRHTAVRWRTSLAHADGLYYVYRRKTSLPLLYLLLRAESLAKSVPSGRLPRANSLSSGRRWTRQRYA